MLKVVSAPLGLRTGAASTPSLSIEIKFFFQMTSICVMSWKTKLIIFFVPNFNIQVHFDIYRLGVQHGP